MDEVALVQLGCGIVHHEVAIENKSIPSTLRDGGVEDGVQFLDWYCPKACDGACGICTADGGGDSGDDRLPSLHCREGSESCWVAGLGDGMCEELVIAAIVCEQLRSDDATWGDVSSLMLIQHVHQCTHLQHSRRISSRGRDLLQRPGCSLGSTAEKDEHLGSHS